MTCGPVIRVCPECGHENSGIRLQPSGAYLPPPRTCEKCDTPLVAPVRKVDRHQAGLPGGS